MNDPFSQRFVDFYESFSVDSIGCLGEIYDTNVVFKDPIHEVTGLGALQRYFSYLCDNQGDSQFSIKDAIVAAPCGDEHQFQSAFFRWQMIYRHPKLATGKTLYLDGGSMIRFTEKIHFQQDFYDLGQMVYQHIPVVGWAVKKINNHLAGPPNLAATRTGDTDKNLQDSPITPFGRDL